MKKNKMMRLASILLVCVLLTTSVISGTFAKYTTQDSASDVARVAKWGVELQVVGNLYGDSYGENNKIVLDNNDKITVQAADYSSNATDVVAPGTQNDEGFTFSLKGQPEVDGQITTEIVTQNIFLKEGTYGIMVPVADGVVNEANFDEFVDDLYTTDGTRYTKADTWTNTSYFTLEDYVELHVDADADKNEAAYYPVVYTMTGNTTNPGPDYTKDTLAEIVTALKEKFKVAVVTNTNATTTYQGVATFDSNTNLATAFLADGLTVKWAWAIDTDDCAKVGDEAGNLCKADTILGNLLAARNGEAINVVKLSGTSYVALEQYTDYCLDTQFSIDITVTQVD